MAEPPPAPAHLAPPAMPLSGISQSDWEPKNGSSSPAANAPMNLMPAIGARAMSPQGQTPGASAAAMAAQMTPPFQSPDQGMQAPPQSAPAFFPPTGQVVPPPYLASQTAARMNAPQEPWTEALQSLMLVFGVLLVAAFVLPWSVAPAATFSWDRIRSASETTTKLLPLLIGSTGILTVLLALIPLAVVARAVAATLLGVVPLSVLALLLGEDQWQALLGLAAMLTLIPGLIVRSEYQGALVARIMVTIGIVCVLVPMLVPHDGALPLVAAFKAISTEPGRAKLLPMMKLGWLVLTLLALLAWLPAPGSGGTKMLAWVLLAKLLVDPMLTFVATTPGHAMGEALKRGLFPLVWLPIVLTAWYALIGYGTASVVGKSLEHD